MRLVERAGAFEGDVRIIGAEDLPGPEIEGIPTDLPGRGIEDTLPETRGREIEDTAPDLPGRGIEDTPPETRGREIEDTPPDLPGRGIEDTFPDTAGGRLDRPLCAEDSNRRVDGVALFQRVTGELRWRWTSTGLVVGYRCLPPKN